MKKITAYKTKDGFIFEDEDTAIEEEFRIRFVKYWNRTHNGDTRAWVFENAKWLNNFTGDLLNKHPMHRGKEE